MKPYPKHNPHYPKSPHRSSKGSICIYILVDPRDWTVRYVGKTNDPKLRLKQHLQSADDKDRNQNWRVRTWVRDLMREHLQPQMRIVTRCGHLNWEKIERRWIAYYRSLGTIYNISAGGWANTSEKGAIPDIINQNIETVARIDRFGIIHRTVPSPSKRHGGENLEKKAMDFLEGKHPSKFFNVEEHRYLEAIKQREIQKEKKKERASIEAARLPKRRPLRGHEMHRFVKNAVREAFGLPKIHHSDDGQIEEPSFLVTFSERRIRGENG